MISAPVRIALTPRMLRFAQCYGQLLQHAAWPHAGGLMRQPMTFVDAVSLMDGFVDRVRRREQERERRKREHDAGRRAR